MKIIFVIRPTVVEVQLAIIGHAATLSKAAVTPVGIAEVVRGAR
jgi:hypothetical protein